MFANVDESMFFEMSEENYSRPAQIPIRRDQFIKMISNSPTEKGDWLIFSHPGHFLVYSKTTRYCIFDATYITFSRIADEPSQNNEIVAVVTEIKINQDCAQRPALERDDFRILVDLFLGHAD